jgi:AcrR family transcriptional regulator
MTAARKKDATPLDRETIVSTTMRIIDAEGLRGMSMRRLASELGVDVAAIYYHVPGKSALHSLLVDEIMAGMVFEDDTAASPEARLVAAMHAYRDGLMKHPHAVELAAARSLRTVAQLRPVEVFVSILFDAGFNATEAVTGIDILGQHVLGLTAIHAHHVTESEFHEERDFDELPEDEFPNMRRVVAEGVYLGFDEEFERGVRALVRGVLAAQAAGEWS